MSTKEEVKPQETKEETTEEQQPQEEVEEEEPVDVELQKQMKNLKFDDSAFVKKDSGNKKKDKKEDKKSKKNKGQDFLDYASKNNIQINIEYEEDKIQEKRKKYFDKKDQQYDNKTGGRYQKKYQNDNNYKYNNRNQGGYKRPQKRAPFKFGGNKFDACNIQKGPYDQMPYQENTFVPKPAIILTTDKDVLAYIEEMFSAQTLNKDIYLRKHLSEEGEIDVNDIANYYTIKKSNVPANKIPEILKESKTLEIKEDNGKTLVVVKGIKEMNLQSIESIAASKKAAKMQRMQQNMYPQMGGEFPPYMGYNYIHMQNKYFLPSQGFYPGYSQPVYQYQQPKEEQK